MSALALLLVCAAGLAAVTAFASTAMRSAGSSAVEAEKRRAGRGLVRAGVGWTWKRDGAVVDILPVMGSIELQVGYASGVTLLRLSVPARTGDLLVGAGYQPPNVWRNLVVARDHTPRIERCDPLREVVTVGPETWSLLDVLLRGEAWAVADGTLSVYLHLDVDRLAIDEWAPALVRAADLLSVAPEELVPRGLAIARSDADPKRRGAALRALAARAPGDALPIAMEAAGSEDPVEAEGAWLVRAATGEDVSKRYRDASFRLVRDLAGVSAWATLRPIAPRLLGSPDADIVNELLRVGEHVDLAPSAIAELVTDVRPGVAATALAALERLRSSLVEKAAILALNGPAAKLAVEMLAATGTADAVTPLLDYAAREGGAFRTADEEAAEAIRRIQARLGPADAGRLSVIGGGEVSMAAGGEVSLPRPAEKVPS